MTEAQDALMATVNELFDAHLRGGRRNDAVAQQVAALLQRVDGGAYRVEGGRVHRPLGQN